MPKKKSVDDPQRRLALASAVAHRVQILDIRLKSASASADNSSLSPGKEINVRFKTKAIADETGRLLEVVVSTSVTSDDTVGLRIEATFVLRYELTIQGESLSEEHFGAFAELNGLFNVWPYWREFVQSITTRMGFRPLILPVRQPVQRVAIAKQSSSSTTSKRRLPSRKK